MRFPPLPIFTTGFCFFGLGPLIPSPFSVPSGALITRKVPPELVALLANSNSFFKFTSRVICMDAFKLSVNLFVFLRNWPFRVSMRFPCRFFAMCFFLKFKAASCCDADDELCFFFLNDDDCGICIHLMMILVVMVTTSSSLTSSEKRKVAKKRANRRRRRR